jgi:phosphoserine phosphatase RsbU/P
VRDVNSAELFDDAPCGYLLTDASGTVVRVNAEGLRIIGCPEDEVVGARGFASLLSVGGRMFLETHLRPMLEHDGVVREVALDVVRPDGTQVPVLMNANRVRARGGESGLRIVLVETRDRRSYEANLLWATQVAEEARQHAAALAETLQQTLIPPTPPPIPHLSLAAAYRPAGNGREVGGDFYDIVKTGPETWLVVLGDVSGKGIPAATLTSFVRYTIRALAIDFPDPAELLLHLDAALREHPTDRYCTVAVGHLTRRCGGWDVTLSLGGHPPGILRTARGAVREIGEPGTPVGLLDDPEFHTVRHRLTDETLTLYTDGVTEARGPSGVYGEERLLDLLRALPHDPRSITDGVTRTALAHQDGNASDDIAVVTFASS